MNITEIDKFIEILQKYENIAYLILFMGSMVETIIGLSFLFFGEVFFLAGGILASTGKLDIKIVILVQLPLPKKYMIPQQNQFFLLMRNF